MEKLSRIKSFFKFLSKQRVALTIQNPTLSPCRSPARVSIVPKEARRKHKGSSFSAREPSSPKVSCIGQVQCKKKRKAKKQKMVQQLPIINNDSSLPCHEKKKILLWISNNGSGEGKKQSGRALVLEEKELDTVKAPSLGTMNKFASGRGSLCDFDFKLAER